MTLVVKRARAVRGRLVAEGASVAFLTVDLEGDLWSMHITARADGSFQFHGVPLADVTLRAELDVDGVTWRGHVQVPAKHTGAVELKLEPPK